MDNNASHRLVWLDDFLNYQGAEVVENINKLGIIYCEMVTITSDKKTKFPPRQERL